jgi:hypothetical protein
MRKKVVFFSIFFLMTLCYGKELSFFKIQLRDSGTVGIEIEEGIEGYSYAELLRGDSEGNYIPIFEFSTGDSLFIDSHSPGSCYSLKVYFTNGSSILSEPKCVGRAAYLKMVDTGFFTVFIVLLLSFILPAFFQPAVFSRSSIYADKMFRMVRSFIGEESGDVIFFSRQHSLGSPLLMSIRSLTGIFADYCDGGRVITSDVPFQEKFSEKTWSDKVNITGESGLPLKVFPKCDQSGGQAASFEFSFSNGSIESDIAGFRRDPSIKTMSASTTVSASVPDLIAEKEVLLSVEAFVISQELEQLKGDRRYNSGAYIFILAISLIIFAGSILYTLDVVYPVLKYLRFFTGGGE